MQSKAKTVKDYLVELPPERREIIEAVRAQILKNLPKGYEEVMQYGMISYIVPLRLYPRGYLDQKEVPLSYVALASQKNYMAVYLTNIYADQTVEKWFKQEYTTSGKKLDMGKSCIRFKKMTDLPLPLIGKVVKLTPVKDYIAMYEKNRFVTKRKK